MTSPSFFAASMSTCANAAPVARAATTATALRHMGHLPTIDSQRFPVRALRHDALEGAQLRECDAPLLRADGRCARVEGAHGIDHELAEFDDGEVARAQPLARAVGDRAHRFPHRHVLHGNAADPGEVSGLHGGAILEEVVVARAELAPV